MTTDQIIAILVGLGVGGALGALAALYSAANRFAAALEGFEPRLRAYLEPRTDPESLEIKEALVDVEERFSLFRAALQKAGRALSRRH
jgi:hypothetical protein